MFSNEIINLQLLKMSSLLVNYKIKTIKYE